MYEAHPYIMCVARTNGGAEYMGKKAKARKKKLVFIDMSLVERQLERIEQQLIQADYTAAVMTCERLLRYLPQRVPPRAEVLAQLGIAHGMLQNFRQSYGAFTAALDLNPRNARLWSNRCMASRLTSRFGQALRDIERAVELNTRSELVEQLNKDLEFCRMLAEESASMRGPDFTVDQLIEQENLFQHGLQCMDTKKWQEGALAFQRSIAMGDCLPQPWGNLGVCLLMRERYDEAEAAWRRALEIDPEYDMAKNNLAALPNIRREGPPDLVVLNEPFKDSKIKQTLTFIEEE